MNTSVGWILGGTLLVGGCATTQHADPLESVNRRVFSFNTTVDDAVLAPVARGYRRVVPTPVRTGVSNFFANPKDLWSSANLFLQGRPADGTCDLLRFATNTTVGLLGIRDQATPWGMARHGEDFGQTLGKWGAGPGAFLVLPLLGPTTTRDATNVPFALLITPQALVTSSAVAFGMTAIQTVDARSELLDTSSFLETASLDRYAFTRDAYLQRRAALVGDGTSADAPGSAIPPTCFRTWTRPAVAS